MLYTFMTEVEGGTYIEQFVGKDIDDCLAQWIERSSTKPITSVHPVGSEDNPTRVNEVSNVWCFDWVDDNDRFFLVHIVATVG